MNVLDATELYTLKWQIVCYVSHTAKKKKRKKPLTLVSAVVEACTRPLEEWRVRCWPLPVNGLRLQNSNTDSSLIFHCTWKWELKVFPKKAVFFEAEANESIWEDTPTLQRGCLFSELSRFAPCFLLGCHHKPGLPDATCGALHGRELSEQRRALLQRTNGSRQTFTAKQWLRQQLGSKDRKIRSILEGYKSGEVLVTFT